MVAGSRTPEEVARDAWQWLKHAETRYRKSEDRSADEIQAIQAMALSAIAALTAEQAEENRKRR